jgi:hypothetical protein
VNRRIISTSENPAKGTTIFLLSCQHTVTIKEERRTYWGNFGTVTPKKMRCPQCGGFRK